MPSTISLIKRLKADYPEFSFEKSSSFSWSHVDKIIYYSVGVEKHNDSLLLHELSHGLLDHHDYKRDIELIAMESAAWDKAKKLSQKYNVEVNEEFIQDNLDTYRDWLHRRSTCPDCTATGLQVKKDSYDCLSCGYSWKVNEARTCALRRYGTN